MTLYEQISKLGGYFNSLRLHEGLLVVDLKLPTEWKIKEIVGSRGNKIQLQEGSKSKTQKIISFFSSFDKQESEILEEEVLAVIKWNKEREEKQVSDRDTHRGTKRQRVSETDSERQTKTMGDITQSQGLRLESNAETGERRGVVCCFGSCFGECGVLILFYLSTFASSYLYHLVFF